MRTLHIMLAISGLMLSTVAMAAEQTPATPGAEIDPMQQMVCRKDKETGSLVKSKKTCHTRSQWAFIDDENQRTSRKFVEDNSGRPTSN